MNEVTIVVKGTNLSKGALKEPQDDLTKLETKADGAGAGLDRLGGKTKQTRDEFGRFKKATDEAGESVRGLGDEFDRTSREADAGWLTKMRDRIVGAFDGGGKDGGKKAGESFGEGFMATFKPGLIGAAILAAVTFAPGALLAATGLAGLGLGIVGQLGSPAVMKAANDTGQRIMDALITDTKPFEEPLVQALGSLAGAAQNALSKIDFGTLAKEVEPLATGIGALVANLMPGLNKAFAAAMPVLDTFAADLPILGDAISQMFEDFAKGGTGAAEGIHMLMATLVGLILIVGKIVLAFSNLTEHIVAGGERLSWWASAIGAHVPVIGSLTGHIHDMWREIQTAGDSTVVAVRSLHDIGGAAQLSASDLQALTDKLSEVSDATSNLAAKWEAKLFGMMMGVDQATIQWHQSLNTLKDTLSQNGLAIDRHTKLISENSKAGLENRSAILAAVQANQAQYQAMVAGGISSIDAAKAYDQNTDALRKQLLAAHYTAAQVDDLIGKYANVPDKVNTALAVSGLTDAINNLGNLLAEIHGINGRDFGFTITEKHVYEADYRQHSAGEHASGGITGAATGGIRGALTMVGEQGRELVRLPYGSQVIPNGTTENMLAGVGAGARGGDGASAGGLTMRVVGDASDWFVEGLKNMIRNNRIQIFDSTGVPVTVY